MLLVWGVRALFVLDVYHIYYIDIIVVWSSWLLVVVIVRMDGIGVEITDVLSLCV